jgi:N-acetylneuraminic acid mutarotase
VNNAANRVELYDTHIDDWLELPRINEGRHYHSSCHFNHKFIYVFGGIQNSNKKYSNSIEKFSFDIENYQNRYWERVNLSKVQMPAPITARQGAGMCQVGPDEIIIVGGFNGKFLNDYFTISFEPESGEAKKVYK